MAQMVLKDSRRTNADTPAGEQPVVNVGESNDKSTCGSDADNLEIWKQLEMGSLLISDTTPTYLLELELERIKKTYGTNA